MNRIIFTLVLSFFLGVGFAQQEAQYTQFMHNKLVINPAYAGARDVPSLMALYRNQWTGFKGAPKSILFSFNSPLVDDRVGFGLTISNHSAGIEESWYANMAYSYKIQLSKQTNIRVALQGSVRQLRYNFDSPDLSPLIRNDPSIVGTSEAEQYKGNFGLGFYLTHQQFYLGASVPHFFKNVIGFNDDGSITAEERPHVYVMGGATFSLNESIKLEPSFLTKYVKGAPFDMDLNVSLIFDDRIATGLSYRMGGGQLSFAESIDLTLFYKVTQDLGIGLAYDFTLSEIKEFTSGSFEVMLRYDIRKKAADMANPRFF